ncbi:MAG: foldase protein PrsA [Cellulosilyticaceae bacterium]
MKRIKKLMLALVAGVMMISSLTACGSSQGKTVAVIDGEKIPDSLYRTYLWTTQQFYEQLSGPTVWDMELEGKKTEDIAKERALESTVLSVVTAQKAKELGIKLTPEQKKAAKDNAEHFVKTNPEVISNQGFGKKDIETFLLATDLSTSVQQKLSEKYMPSEEEIITHIEQNKRIYEEVTVEHVLLSTVDENMRPLPSAEIVEKEKLAKDILEKAQAGADMKALATAYSEDPNVKNNDGVETLRRDQVTPEFEKAAFDGEVGEVIPEVVESARGYHIIKVMSHKLDKDKMRQDYIDYEKAKFANSEFEELIKNAKVEKTDYYNEVKIIKTVSEDQVQQNKK